MCDSTPRAKQSLLSTTDLFRTMIHAWKPVKKPTYTTVIIIRPHRSTTYVDAAYTVNDPVAWSVGLSVGLSPSEPCKTILKRSRYRLRLGLRWAHGKTYYIQRTAFGKYCIVFNTTL